MTHVIEAMDDAERWYPIEWLEYGGNGRALDHMSDWHLRHPRIPLRVVGVAVSGKRELLYLHDPRPEDL